jgi:3'(2'), 5'-bisphosphate nucleotidase
MNNNTELLNIALAAAVKAGREVMDVYGRMYSVAEKDDRSPLTEADTRSHEVIEHALSDATPEIPILSEEGVHFDHGERSRWDRFWLVDPLDGTKEFIKHNDEFTVNIALVSGTTPLLGVVYAPALQALYAGIWGVGAWRVPQDHTVEAATIEKLQYLGVPLPEAAARADRPWTIVASRSHMSSETTEFVENRRREHPDLHLVSAGSSLKICRVAEGSADEYPRFAPTMEWDTAAGDAVARAAGCSVMQWNVEMGRPGAALFYNKKDLHNPWFLVHRAEG